jgi:predicted flap endonuclease-1-like 5' DNA nuclease
MELTIPELTVVHIGLLALALVVGLVLGWVFRGDKAGKEKIAINAGWQDQLESQQSEQDRLAEQNKSLMEQISQYQGSHQESINRAKELSESLRESFKARDELQKKVGEIRAKLEATVAQRDKLQTVVENQESQNRNTVSGLKEKDDKIFHLSRELNSWQSRVPPLVEKFQERDRQAKELEAELAKAQERIASFEEMAQTNQTRIEPVDAGSLDSLDASNEPHTDTLAPTVSDLQDQIDIETGEQPIVEEIVEESEAEAAPELDASGAVPDELIAADEFVEDDDKNAEEAEPQTRRIIDEELAEPEAEDKDDLKQIKGVGPAIEKTLNELGIYSFNQIAEMSEYEIDRVAQRLKGFRSRIYRQDWIGQARDLRYQKNNNLT